MLGECNEKSAGYVSKYVIKRLTDPKDNYVISKLGGRDLEFATMSLKPGIGADMMHDVASSLMYYDLEKTLDDVPQNLRHAKAQLPLGRYLRQRLRVLIGRDEKTPESVIKKAQEELQPLRESAFNNSRSFKCEVVDANAQAALNVENRMRIFKKRGDL